MIVRKLRNNGVTNISPGHQREKDRGTDSLLVVLDEMNKKQDNNFVASGLKRLNVIITTVKMMALLSSPSSYHPVLSRFYPNQHADL